LAAITKLDFMSKAKDFTLKNTKLEDIKLSDYQGQHVLLLFFPLAFTSTCTKELCEIRDNIATYNNLNTTVLGISVDSPFTLAKYKEEQGINFDLLSDFNKDVSSDYGALYEVFVHGLKGVSKRAAFVVDKNGDIQYEEILENAREIPNFVAINELLQKLS